MNHNINKRLWNHAGIINLNKKIASFLIIKIFRSTEKFSRIPMIYLPKNICAIIIQGLNFLPTLQNKIAVYFKNEMFFLNVTPNKKPTQKDELVFV